MVAPNSPKERAKPNTKPANTPGRERGKVIVKKTRQGEAPSVCAACSNLNQCFLRKDELPAQPMEMPPPRKLIPLPSN